MTTAAATMSSEPTLIQQAFAQAKEEHSKAEQAPPAEASPASGKDTLPDESMAATPATKTAQPDNNDLISDAEYQVLSQQHKDDPAALAKELKAVFTKKTQALAEQRKSVERLQQYAEFLDDLEADPAGTITRAAQQFGLTVTSAEAKTEQAATVAAQTTANAVVDQFRAALGPDLDFLADKLAPALETLVKGAIEQAIQPVKAQTEQIVTKAAEAEVESVLTSFTEKYPDWKTHEAEMVTLGQSIQPGPGVTAFEHLERLYRLATFDLQVAEATKRQVEKMTKAAATDEGKGNPVSGAKVTATPPENASFRDAYAAAKRGEQW